MRKLAYTALAAVGLVCLVLCFPVTRKAVAQGIMLAINKIGDPIPAFAFQMGGSDGTSTRAFKVAADGTAAMAGSLTNNNAAPAATNVGALGYLANAAVPTWIEGDQVLGSADLSGRQRMIGTTANDTTAVSTGIETQPGIAKATPTAITAGRSEKLQQSTTNGGVFANLTGGAGVLVTDVFGNDATAVGNGLQVHPGIAKAAPTAITAGRSELLQLDSVSGGVYFTEAPTTNAVGLTTTCITTVTASQSIKGSAGNLYGFSIVNGVGAGCFLQCVNSSGAGTLGTATIWQAPIVASQTVYQSPGPIPLGSFSTGIACGMASAVNGASNCGTAATAVCISYK